MDFKCYQNLLMESHELATAGNSTARVISLINQQHRVEVQIFLILARWLPIGSIGDLQNDV